MDPFYQLFPGVILYILLVGYPPFWDEDQHRLYAQVRFLFILLFGSTSRQPSFLNKTPFVLICLMPCSAFLWFSQPHVNSTPLVLSKRCAVVNSWFFFRSRRVPTTTPLQNGTQSLQRWEPQVHSFFLQKNLVGKISQ